MNVVTLRGGRVIDPGQGIDGSFDLTIEGDRIASIEPTGARPSRPDDHVEDVAGLIVVLG